MQTTILITNDTYAAVQDHVTAVDRGEMKLAGRQRPVDLYEVLPLAGRSGGAVKEGAMGVVSCSSWEASCWRRRVVLPRLPVIPFTLLTEIRPGQGDIRVKLAAEAEWKAPLPLLSLRAATRFGSRRTPRPS